MDSITLRQKVEKRTREIQNILNKFLSKWNSVEHNVKIKIKNDAAEAIASIYFKIINENVKGQYLKEDGFISLYKVASGTEIACMLYSPAGFEDNSLKWTMAEKRKLNAELSMYLALQFLNAVYHAKFGVYLPEQSKDKNTISSMINHKRWVKYFEADENAYPVFLNATFWEAYTSAILLEEKLKTSLN